MKKIFEKITPGGWKTKIIKTDLEAYMEFIDGDRFGLSNNISDEFILSKGYILKSNN